jgi:4'-phosphopantetheinyl transferase
LTPLLPGTSHHLPPENPVLREDEIHVWLVSLTEAQLLHDIHSYQDELQQSLNSGHGFTGRPFAPSRLALRKILSKYIGIAPSKIEFSHTNNGKPFLARKEDHGDLSFNIAHSDDYALIAIGLNQEIGVDIEKLRDTINIEIVMKHYFSVDERHNVKHALEDQYNTFFRYWVRKEALIKAVGRDISYLLNTKDIFYPPQHGRRTETLYPKQPTDHTPWFGRELPIDETHVAYLVHQSEVSQVYQWLWNQ